jgi:hypothetical protein
VEVHLSLVPGGEDKGPGCHPHDDQTIDRSVSSFPRSQAEAYSRGGSGRDPDGTPGAVDKGQGKIPTRVIQSPQGRALDTSACPLAKL